MTVLLCHSQTPPEQRGVQGTLLSTRRAPAERVIPGLDPGIQINNKANLLTWIAGSSPAMTRGKRYRG